MNIYEKVLRFCIKNKIQANLGYMWKKQDKCIQIWQCQNSYYQIHIFDEEKYGSKRRTVITDNSFGLDTEKNNGNYRARISYKTLIKNLKNNLEVFQTR